VETVISVTMCVILLIQMGDKPQSRCVTRAAAISVGKVCHDSFTCVPICITLRTLMGWLRLVGSLKLYVFLAKEPYKRDDIL